jgi:hypothetical protein
MARLEIPFQPDLPPTPLAEYDPAASAFIDATFAEYDANVAALGERQAVWPRDEVVTRTGMYLARLLDRDTIMYDIAYADSNATTHSEQFVISDQVALGNVLYSGGTVPGAHDWDDHGHNADPVYAFEALLPSGLPAPVSVRIGVRREAAVRGLWVVSDLSAIDSRYRMFDPMFYEHATPRPLMR